MNDDENTQPGTQLARIESMLKDVAKAVVDPPPPEEPYGDGGSAEFKRTPSGRHIQFVTHGPFWRNLLIFGWQQASTVKRFNLIVGAIGGQSAILWLADLARRYLLARWH